MAIISYCGSFLQICQDLGGLWSSCMIAENSWFKSPEAALGLGQKSIVRECGVCT